MSMFVVMHEHILALVFFYPYEQHTDLCHCVCLSLRLGNLQVIHFTLGHCMKTIFVNVFLFCMS